MAKKPCFICDYKYEQGGYGGDPEKRGTDTYPLPCPQCCWNPKLFALIEEAVEQFNIVLRPFNGKEVNQFKGESNEFLVAKKVALIIQEQFALAKAKYARDYDAKELCFPELPSLIRKNCEVTLYASGSSINTHAIYQEIIKLLWRYWPKPENKKS